MVADVGRAEEIKDVIEEVENGTGASMFLLPMPEGLPAESFWTLMTGIGKMRLYATF